MRRPWVWLLALGGVLVVAGAGLFALANSAKTADFGWSAYMPLQPGDPAPYRSELLLFPDGSVLWTPQHALGAGLIVVGLLLLVGTGGWLLGRRAGPRP